MHSCSFLFSNVYSKKLVTSKACLLKLCDINASTSTPTTLAKIIPWRSLCTIPPTIKLLGFLKTSTWQYKEETSSWLTKRDWCVSGGNAL